MSEAEHYFLAECAAHARALPLADAARFLKGCVLSCHPAAGAELQTVFQALSQSDTRLQRLTLKKAKG
jgi:hypothetical protein